MVLVAEESCDELLEALEFHEFEAKRYYPPEGAGLVIV